LTGTARAPDPADLGSPNRSPAVSSAALDRASVDPGGLMRPGRSPPARSPDLAGLGAMQLVIASEPDRSPGRGSKRLARRRLRSELVEGRPGQSTPSMAAPL
jgi:hypothetical protein